MLLLFADFFSLICGVLIMKIRDDDTEVVGLLEDVRQYALKHKGRIYAPIDHHLFADIPHHHGADRFDALVPYLPSWTCTCLDIGTHWGYLAHRLERLGHDVTAAEINSTFLLYLYRIRRLYGDSFSIWPKTVFTLPDLGKYEMVFALNIFHHFIKDEKTHETFEIFLSALNCHTMFFQSHNPIEGQMVGAFKNYDPEQFVDFILESTSLTSAKKILDYGGRPVYKITK
jgi:hypothetical protein